MKKISIFIILCVSAFILVGCGRYQSKGAAQIKQDQATVGEQQTIYAKALPVPIFDYSQTRSSLIQIYKAKTSSVSTWSVMLSYDGKALFMCPSIGFPIPADTQLTNPEQLTRIHVGAGNYVSGPLAQAEPDGTYTSGNTSGTYVLCARQNGQVSVLYWEPPVATFGFPVQIQNGQIVDSGQEASISIYVK